MNHSVSESGTYCIYLAALQLNKYQPLFASTSVNNCKIMFFPMDGRPVHHKLAWALSGFSKSYRVSCPHSNSWVKGGIIRVKCLIQECRTRFSQVVRPDLLTLSPECQPFDQWVFQIVGSVAFLTFNTLTSVCIFSILFSIHFPGCWQGELVKQWTASIVIDHVFYPQP